MNTHNIYSLFFDAWTAIGGIEKQSNVAVGTVFCEMDKRKWQWSFYYHTWTHVCSLVSIYNNIIPKITLSPEAILAIYYHDVIYDPTRTDNEKKSADFAVSEMKGAPQASLDKIRTIIEGTKGHNNPIDKDMAFFLDMDLVMLGVSYETFMDVGCRIRREYSFVDDATFEMGRVAFFKKMLSRKCIYHTYQFYKLFEKQAQSNMKKYIKEYDRKNKRT